MPIVYFDRAVLEGGNDCHPAMIIDENSPCYRMVREAIDGKSVFHWNRSEAYAMYKWYCIGWKTVRIVDEFGEGVSEYNFKDIVKKSHYLVPEGEGKKGRLVPSQETMEELYNAVEMERRILESNGDADA